MLEIRFGEFMQKLREFRQELKERVQQWENDRKDRRERNSCLGEAGKYLRPGHRDIIVIIGLFLIPFFFLRSVLQRFSAYYFSAAVFFSLIMLSGSRREHKRFREYMDMCEREGLIGDIEKDFLYSKPIGRKMAIGGKYLFIRGNIYVIPYTDILSIYYSYYSVNTYRSTSRRSLCIVYQWRGEKRNVSIADGMCIDEEIGVVGNSEAYWNELAEKVRANNPNVKIQL